VTTVDDNDNDDDDDDDDNNNNNNNYNNNKYQHETQTELSDSTLHVRWLCFLFHKSLEAAELFLFRSETVRQNAAVKQNGNTFREANGREITYFRRIRMFIAMFTNAYVLYFKQSKSFLYRYTSCL